MPRRKREQSEQYVLPSGILLLTIEYVSSFDDLVLVALALEILGQHLLGEARVPLIDVDGDQRKFERRPALDLAQQVQERVRILAATDRHEHAVARLDQLKIVAGTSHFGEQPFF